MIIWIGPGATIKFKCKYWKKITFYRGKKPCNCSIGSVIKSRRIKMNEGSFIFIFWLNVSLIYANFFYMAIIFHWCGCCCWECLSGYWRCDDVPQFLVANDNAVSTCDVPSQKTFAFDKFGVKFYTWPLFLLAC